MELSSKESRELPHDTKMKWGKKKKQKCSDIPQWNNAVRDKSVIPKISMDSFHHEQL